MSSINKYFFGLLLPVLVAVSLLQSGYQNQYKYTSFDLFSIRADTAVECLADPEQLNLTIRKILHSVEEPGSHRVSHVSYIPYPNKQDNKHYSLLLKILIPTNAIVSVDITRIHPLISILKKSYPTHSSTEDDPFPIYC